MRKQTTTQIIAWTTVAAVWATTAVCIIVKRANPFLFIMCLIVVALSAKIVRSNVKKMNGLGSGATSDENAVIEEHRQ